MNLEFGSAHCTLVTKYSPSVHRVNTLWHFSLDVWCLLAVCMFCWTWKRDPFTWLYEYVFECGSGESLLKCSSCVRSDQLCMGERKPLAPLDRSDCDCEWSHGLVLMNGFLAVRYSACCASLVAHQEPKNVRFSGSPSLLVSLCLWIRVIQPQVKHTYIFNLCGRHTVSPTKSVLLHLY